MRSRPTPPDQGPPYRRHDLAVAILLIFAVIATIAAPPRTTLAGVAFGAAVIAAAAAGIWVGAASMQWRLHHQRTDTARRIAAAIARIDPTLHAAPDRAELEP